MTNKIICKNDVIPFIDRCFNRIDLTCKTTQYKNFKDFSTGNYWKINYLKSHDELCPMVIAKPEPGPHPIKNSNVDVCTILE